MKVKHALSHTSVKPDDGWIVVRPIDEGHIAIESSHSEQAGNNARDILNAHEKRWSRPQNIIVVERKDIEWENRICK